MGPLQRASLLLAALLALFGFAAPASAEDRTLYLYYTHTGETAKITFRRDGRYDQAGLNELNHFLRDWRRNETIKMDPALFDLVWSVYQEVGATEPIHVVSAYRAPETNEMLRSRPGSGVAENSRHTMGMAMDFFIPGIPLSKLREVAMKHQVGGVGYYPTSGSPFVHLDTGNVRAWPRMTTAQLRQLFPDGKTLHLGADGTILSQSGRQYAAAQWQQCHSVPCIDGVANTQVNTGNGRGLLDLFFGTTGGSQDIQVANNAPVQRQVTTVQVAPPVPASRSDLVDLRQSLEPPIPAEMPQAILVAMRTTDQVVPNAAPIATTLSNDALDAIETGGNAPAARLLMSNPAPEAGLLSAYAPTGDPEPDAQRALQMLIERRDAAQQNGVETVNPADILLRGTITTASLGPTANIGVNQSEPPALDLFTSTFEALNRNTDRNLMPMLQTAALQQQTGYDLMAVEPRRVTLVEPDLGHVDQAFVAPVSLDSNQFAVLFQPDQGDFSPMTELGPHTGLVRFTSLAPGWLPANHFARIAPVFHTAL
ncbi:MAG: DUF882 domain-containing protein [Hyphomicrobiaceae bacterium]|nr:DUF882 domain-containing protein [Hyphomicrobiaceae bacterium]